MYASLLKSVSLNICGQAELLNPTCSPQSGTNPGSCEGLANTSMSLAHWFKKRQQSVTLMVPHRPDIHRPPGTRHSWYSWIRVFILCTLGFQNPKSSWLSEADLLRPYPGLPKGWMTVWSPRTPPIPYSSYVFHILILF